MGASQEERKKSANTLAAKVLGEGYIDGRYGVLDRSDMYPPLLRYCYKAGYSDGLGARERRMIELV